MQKKDKKDLAIESAEILNKLRQDIRGNSYTYMEWVRLLKRVKISYYQRTLPRLINLGILKEEGVKIVNNRALTLYYLSTDPIHYSVLYSIHEESRALARKVKNEKKEEPILIMNQPELETKITQKDIISFSQDKNEKRTLALSFFRDIDLVEELRNRGFEVTAEKVTTIKL